MNSDDDRLQQDIFTLISDSQGIKREDLSLNKSLNFDLGVDGDDAVDLFKTYAEQFHVDLAPLGTEWDRYFGPEGISPLWLIQRLTKRPKRMLPLPVSRLVDCARAGRWISLSDQSTAEASRP